MEVDFTGEKHVVCRQLTRVLLDCYFLIMTLKVCFTVDFLLSPKFTARCVSRSNFLISCSNVLSSMRLFICCIYIGIDGAVLSVMLTEEVEDDVGLILVYDAPCGVGRKKSFVYKIIFGFGCLLMGIS